MALKLLLVGTGTFALPTFRVLCDGPHDVLGLVTQPDRHGPGQHRHRHPVKEELTGRGLAVYQPADVNAAESIELLDELGADLCVVAAYGQILSPEFLQVPSLGAINLHASLLPRHRGASPIHHAILAGDAETGVSVFQIEPRVDTGPVLGSVSTPILPRETSGELEQRLSELAAELTSRVLDELVDGRIVPLHQDESQATRAPRLTKADGAIDWDCEPAEVDRQVRAMQPWPRAFTFLLSSDSPPRRLIVIEVEPGDRETAHDGDPGRIVIAEAGRLVVNARGGTVRLLTVQPEGRRAMSAEEFLRGAAIAKGDRLGRSGQ